MRRCAASVLVLGASIATFCAGHVCGQAPVPIGTEFQVNGVTPSGGTGRRSVAVDSDGDFVVVWTNVGSDGSLHGVFGRRFTSSGAPLGVDFQINTYTLGVQIAYGVAADSDGDFVVVWASTEQDGNLAGVFARRFASSGTALAAEFQVNVYTAGTQDNPAVSRDADGDFVVVWEQGGPYRDVFARRFNASGTPLGGVILVNSFTAEDQRAAAIDLEPDGDFVIVWQSDQQDGVFDDVFGQRFDSAGAKQGPEFQVNTFFTSLQYLPDVAVDHTGAFVVAWVGRGPGHNNGTFIRRFNASGAPQGPEIPVHHFFTGDQETPSIECDADGDFVIAWSSRTNGNPTILQAYAQHFRRSGAPTRIERIELGAAFGGSWTNHPAVGVEPGGDFVIAWAAYPYGSDDVFAQRFDVPSVLDLDGNGQITALADGLLLLRILFGFTGTTLTNGAVGAGCTRCDSAAIVPFLESEAGAVIVAPKRLGGEFQVNAFTAGAQRTRTGSTAVESNGDFVAVWESPAQDGSELGVFGRRFTSAGAALGSDFRVNAYTVGDQVRPSAATDADGDFVVVWSSYLQDGQNHGVFGRRFSSTGAALATEFQVGLFTAGFQSWPAVDRDADGDFVVVWNDYGRDGSSYGMFGRRFSSSGAPLGGDFLVNTVTYLFQGNGTIDVDFDGDFVVVWQSGAYYAHPYVRGQRFSSSGAKQGPDFTANSGAVYSYGVNAAVGTAPNGSFVVAWSVDGEVRANRFDSSGTRLTNLVHVNSHSTGDQDVPAVGVAANGDFVVAWEGAGPGDETGIFARHFRASGVPTSDDLLVNTTLTSLQDSPSVGVDAEGDFVISWSGYPAGSPSLDALAQRFDVPPLFDIDGNGQLTALTDGQLVLRFLFGFTGSTLTNGAVGANCTRCDSATIVPYLQSLL